MPSLPISGRPDLLEDETGSKYLPVFSQEEQIPRDYIKKHEKKVLLIKKPFLSKKLYP